ncbi:type II/III secretion system protein [Legionella dresdenensis]|uniref:Type II/III secretion system protein n=1 Tax=Legionella dresdenensis TaxID=450200 RepID=A0ABV8CDA9_9GAMM
MSRLFLCETVINMSYISTKLNEKPGMERTEVKKYIVLLWLLSGSLFAAGMMTKVINLHYQQAQTVIQLVQPLLQPGEQITGNGQTLVVKVSPETLTQIRLVLNKIDVPPVTFRVTVYQGDPNFLRNQNSIGLNISTQSRARLKRYQSVTVLNGESAFISSGDDQPLVSTVGVGLWTGVGYQRRQVQNGLLVEPVLQGQQVKLVIRRIREQTSPVNNQVIQQQQVDTTIMAPLNEWVNLAAAEGPPAGANTQMVIHAGNSFARYSNVYIKVEIIGR